MNKFYLTTAIPYVNGKPHIGHMLEYVQADSLRNFYRIKGVDTLLLSGADENALKNVQTAEKEGVPIKEFLDRNSQVFKQAFEYFGIHLDVFQRSSSPDKHFPGVQKLWQLCNDSGDIYKKSYSGFYCVGCEEFKTAKELVDGLCPIHQTKPELVEEENYFFRLSNYQNQLIKLIETDTLKITPANKKHETLSFIKQGLEDFSISRSKQRARGVGVPVPGDSDQVIYVWFDALNVYMTGVGFGWDEQLYQKWWPADLHIIGKDISRFHTIYWPAMLLSARLPLPKGVLIHGFITSGGQKMSKTVGNVIDPYQVVEQFGLEPVRYYLLSQIPTDGDGDFTIERFKEVYTAELANGLGNLVARVAKLCEKNQVTAKTYTQGFDPEIERLLGEYRFSDCLAHLKEEITQTDKLINDEKPWQLPEDKIKPVLELLVGRLQHIGFNLQPFLPQTAAKILDQFSGQIKSSTPLFPRLA